MTISGADFPNRLADRLAGVRRQRFVGRQAELELFQTAIVDPDNAFVVLHIVGPGGVGKTTLLHEIERVAQERGRTVVYLDGRNYEPSSTAFVAAVQETTRTNELPAGAVLLIDTYEALAPLDDWLRSSYLPQLPAQTLVIIAGRHSPAEAWRSDSGWSEITRIITLPNLAWDACAHYLTARGIPPHLHHAAYSFTHGHPLALSLVADVYQQDLYQQNNTSFPLQPTQERDVIQTLLGRFLEDAPTNQHREALELCVIARTTTEDLLASQFGREVAYPLFQWLRQLSFVEQGPYGLFPHDLVRDALTADLYWRNPSAYGAYQQAVLTYLRQRAWESRGIEQQRYGLDILFVNRQAPGIKSFFVWDGMDTVYAEPATSADFAAITEMVRVHEGEDSATIVRHWQQRQPEAFLAYRKTDGGDLYGFMVQLALHKTTAKDAEVDPAVAAALSYVQTHNPAQPDDAISHMRFWIAQDTYQAISLATNLSAANCVIHWRTTPRLAWSFVTMANPDFMAPHFESIRFTRTPEADFVVGQRKYGIFSHDWKVDPVSTWLVDTKHADIESLMATTPPSGPTYSMTQVEFSQAVRQALRDYTRPDQLATNPLLQTALLANDTRTADALRGLLRQVVANLSHNPKDAKFYRALWHTYIEPQATQEQAAEFLDLPFNTYRYHLNSGLERLIASLWRLETTNRQT